MRSNGKRPRHPQLGSKEEHRAVKRQRVEFRKGEMAYTGGGGTKVDRFGHKKKSGERRA